MKGLSIEERLQKGLNTAFIDEELKSDLEYRSKFIYNDASKGKKVYMELEKELRECDEFLFSVAFITEGGITMLLQTLKELERDAMAPDSENRKKVRGKILTTDYLYFNEPKALEKLASFENIEVRMHFCGKGGPFHTKGYMFRKGEYFSIITGSSNLTGNALSVTKEWNTRIVGTPQGEYVREILIEFDNLWEDALPYEDWIDEYADAYSKHKVDKITAQRVTKNVGELEPNSMQVGFIEKLNEFVAERKDKALLISATGTGKTYAAAFAMKDLNAKRVLFLVHREQIASQALETFARVFGGERTYGLLSGTSKETDADFVFATVQTLCKDETLKSFKPNAFDVVIIDEVHRAGAAMHQKVMNYFKPRLFLGMTASPERTDDFDIFGLFDYNIAYEIRLQHALDEGLLCPFHYFGISEFEGPEGAIGDDTALKDFARLVDEKRVEYIMDKMQFYGFSGDRVKGLIFCSTRKEARVLSGLFNARGLRTLDLSGEDSQTARFEAVERLVSDSRADYLDYILTVDIFNEGVDVPEINQVVMLRPTESPIVFVQQLGRGLRKAKDKEFVVIVDFIGNYANNYMIPLALSGDRSRRKDTLRKVASGTSVIPGCSSIHFDEITRKRIYESIDTAKTNDVRLLRKEYVNLKNRVGRIPGLLDFLDYGAIDPTKYFDKFGSYYVFLEKYEKEYKVRLNAAEKKFAAVVSDKFGRGKRPHEVVMLGLILDSLSYFNKLVFPPSRAPLEEAFKAKMLKDYRIEVSEEELISVRANLSLSFMKKALRDKFDYGILDEEGGCSGEFAALLENNEFVEILKEVVDLGKRIYSERYQDRYDGTALQLYETYTYEDVCRLLNWEKDMNPLNIGGYFYESKTKTLPVFINYEKAHDAIAYEDRFVSLSEIIALSKHPRKVNSTDADHIYKRKPEDAGNRIYLFVRKNKDDKEAKEFYFLGEIKAVGEPEPVVMADTGNDAFEISYVLESPVRDDIYAYITED